MVPATEGMNSSEGGAPGRPDPGGSGSGGGSRIDNAYVPLLVVLLAVILVV